MFNLVCLNSFIALLTKLFQQHAKCQHTLFKCLHIKHNASQKDLVYGKEKKSKLQQPQVSSNFSFHYNSYLTSQNCHIKLLLVGNHFDKTHNMIVLLPTAAWSLFLPKRWFLTGELM